LGESLRALLEGEGVSIGLPDDEAPATEQAKRVCLDQLESAAIIFPRDETFPLPHVEADGDGGLYCEWNYGPRTLAIDFSANGNARLHLLERADDGTLRDEHHALPGLDRLVASLRWVAGYAAAKAVASSRRDSN
jgi:hypothetical protein